MGARFRKSVKICKGMRVNFSKSGASYSFGGRGASLNIGKRGMRATVGIPGSGLSYSTSLSNNSKTVSTLKSESKDHITIQLHLDDDGKMIFCYADGREITDSSYIRKIKATTQYKVEKARLEDIRQNELSRIYEEKQKDAEEFLNIHWLAPTVSSYNDFIELLDTLEPQKYVRQRYDQPKPNIEIIRQNLEIEAKTKVKTSLFWKRKSLIQEYVDKHITDRITFYQQNWENSCSEFEFQEDAKEKEQNALFAKEYEESKYALTHKINGDEDFVKQIIEEWIEECSLPVEININYDFKKSDGVLFIDLDLPEIEDIPANEFVRLTNGNLKEKKKTQQKLRQEYVTLVYGISIFVTANLMNLTPVINTVVLSGYTQRRDSKGNLNDDYILSVKFNREIFEKTIFYGINPAEFCMQFENRCKLTSTMLFQTIEPYS